MRFFNRLPWRLLLGFARRLLRSHLFIVSAVALAALGAGVLATFFLQERAMQQARDEMNKMTKQVNSVEVDEAEAPARPAASSKAIGSKAAGTGPAPDVRPPALAGVAAAASGSQSSPASQDITLPVKGDIVREPGWKKHPRFGDWRYDPGVGIEAQPGAPVKAALPGVVTSIEDIPGEGILVEVEHEGGWKSLYGGLSRATVALGTKVKEGATIGNLDQDQERSILHFELYEGDTPVDVMRLFR